MKILYHHRTLSKDGQTVHIEELTKALRDLGHELVIVGPTAYEKSSFGDDSSITGKIKAMLPGFLYELAELAYSFVAYRQLKDAARQFSTDAIYERYNLFYLPGIWMKKRLGRPLIVEVNAPLAEERAKYSDLRLHRLARWSERKVWRAADAVLPVTNVLADYVRAAGVPEEKIHVIQNGIDRERFPANPDGSQVRKKLGLEGKIVLGFTGFLRDWHGLTRVLDLIAELKDQQDLHFLVVGDGPARAGLEDHARALGLQDSLTVLGVVERDDVAGFVSAFDIALQPHAVGYASPLKMFEYLALGRAIVAPRQPNIEEILTDGDNGLLFDPGQPDSFNDALRLVCTDSALREKLGRRASETIEERGYTWESNARRVIDIATALAGGTAKGA